MTALRGPGLRVLLPLLAFCCGPSVARVPLWVPAEVRSVVTGGRWSAAGVAGVYRLTMRTRSFPEQDSTVQVDWIADAAGNGASGTIVASDIADTGGWLILQPRIVRQGNGWRAVLDGVDRRNGGSTPGIWEVELGEPNRIRSTLRRH